MTYEEFKIAMAAEVTNIVGEEVNVKIHQIQKNNGVSKDAITVMEAGSYVAPTIYLKDFYMRWKEGTSMEDLADEIVEISRESNIDEKLSNDFFLEFSGLKDRICYKLINYEKNKEMLETVPHIPVLDLAMVFYYLMDPDVVDQATIMIRNCDLKRWNIDTPKLVELAKKNTPRLHEWHFVTLSSLMKEIINDEAKKQNEDPVDVEIEDEDSIPMYVLTNKEKYLGAACLFYPQVLNEIANTLEDDLFILPSSIHESIIMPRSGRYSKEELQTMVQEVNETQVEPSEVLSNQVYCFDRKEESIHL